MSQKLPLGSEKNDFPMSLFLQTQMGWLTRSWPYSPRPNWNSAACLIVTQRRFTQLYPIVSERHLLSEKWSLLATCWSHNWRAWNTRRDKDYWKPLLGEGWYSISDFIGCPQKFEWAYWGFFLQNANKNLATGTWCLVVDARKNFDVLPWLTNVISNSTKSNASGSSSRQTQGIPGTSFQRISTFMNNNQRNSIQWGIFYLVVIHESLLLGSILNMKWKCQTDKEHTWTKIELNPTLVYSEYNKRVKWETY